MSDPIVASARAAVSGIREALAVGHEIEALGKDIANLGKADLAARAAYRKRQQFKTGDTTFVSAVSEWKRLREIYDLRQELKTEIMKQYGAKAWQEIEEIEARMKDELQRNFTEDGHDRRKLFMLKVWCFVFAAIITAILWINGTISELSRNI